MSKSKFLMAQKLQKVQVSLMEEEIHSSQLKVLLPLIFKKCLEEKMTFWFSFLEDACVLNLRDVEHENTELNIRYAYHNIPIDAAKLDYYKETLLINAFLITKSPIEFKLNMDNVSISTGKTDNERDTDSIPKEVTTILDSDEVMPKSIRKAVEKIQKKGISVTPEAIRNHLPLSKMSTSNRIECNKYLKKMEEKYDFS